MLSMRTAEAVPILKAAIGIPFRELFKDHPSDLTTNKGHAGQLLERYIGLKNGTNNIDFEDGELKTNKTHKNGSPAETIAITQISRIIDDLLCAPPVEFETSHLCEKLNNLLIVPVVKDGDCGSWYLLAAYNISLQKNPTLKSQLEDDYLSICAGLRNKVLTGNNIGTTNGYYLQVRAKASKPYRAIESKIFDRAVSNKNHAFYLQTRFVRDIIAGVLS